MTVSLALNARQLALCAALAIAAAAGGCSSDGSPGLFSTGALGESPQAAPVKPAIDPVCVNLAADIDRLRMDGAVNGLEKAADGKSSDVKVKRASLATQAQLNKVNADFISKCGPKLPKPAVTAAAVVAPAAAAVKPVAKAGAAISGGVSVVPPTDAPKQ